MRAAIEAISLLFRAIARHFDGANHGGADLRTEDGVLAPCVFVCGTRDGIAAAHLRDARTAARSRSRTAPGARSLFRRNSQRAEYRRDPVRHLLAGGTGTPRSVRTLHSRYAPARRCTLATHLTVRAARTVRPHRIRPTGRRRVANCELDCVEHVARKSARNRGRRRWSESRRRAEPSAYLFE